MDLVVDEAVARLRAAGCVFAEEEAAILVQAASDRSLAELVRRRAGGEPLEQVVGWADFCGVRVRLRPGVFVPRVRSELLVAAAAQRIAERGEKAPTVVDLCCGSGGLGLALRFRVPEMELWAADSDAAAVACAGDNIGGDRVFRGDLFDALPESLRGRIDILLANVPYVASRHLPFLPAEARLHEPEAALDGGADGLDVFRAVLARAGEWLAPGGTAFSEVTGEQAQTATGIVAAAGLRAGLRSDEELEATVVTATRLDR